MIYANILYHYLHNTRFFSKILSDCIAILILFISVVGCVTLLTCLSF